MKEGRKCENCGLRMPQWVPRVRNPESGKLECANCREGHPGRPRAQASIEREADLQVEASSLEPFMIDPNMLIRAFRQLSPGGHFGKLAHAEGEPHSHRGGEHEHYEQFGVINPANALLGQIARQRKLRQTSAFDPTEKRESDGKWTEGPGGSPDHSQPTQQEAPHAVGVSDDPNSQSLHTLTGPKGRDESDDDYNDRLFKKGQEHYQPDTDLEQAARAYRGKLGEIQPDVKDWTGIEADWKRAKEVGDAFDAAKSDPNDPKVKEAYGDLVKQVGDQWKLLTGPKSEGGLGVKVDFVSPEDIKAHYGDKEGLNPYPSAQAQAEDLIKNHHLAIASIHDYPEAYHPLLSNDRGGEYDRFRAVHDAFGHSAVGADFTRHGEWQAWLHHSSMFHGPARLAASTELTGENSYLITHHKPATHKAALLPENLIAMPWDKDGHYIDHFWDNPNAKAAAREHIVGDDVSNRVSLRPVENGKWEVEHWRSGPIGHIERVNSPGGYRATLVDGSDAGTHGKSDEAIDALWDAHLQKKFGSLKAEAHDSGDGQTIYHCPFCGAGQVVAGSDGTTECQFCQTYFTVQVQPQYAAMPQTINGVPVQMPGMPGDPSNPSAPPGSPTTTSPADQTSPDTFQPPGQPESFSPPAAFTPPADAPSTTAAKVFLTTSGGVLNEEAYMRHLAINFADDREAVLAEVRGSR